MRFLCTARFDSLTTLTIEDDILLAEPDTISWLLHSACPIVFHPDTRTLTITGQRYRLSGAFLTEVPVDAVLSTTFPMPPGGQEGQYNDPAENPYPDKYHLELRTVGPL